MCATDDATPGDSNASVADSALRRRWAVQVRDALGELEPVRREAVELAYFQRMTHREIASRLSLPLPDVRRAVASAMALLATALVAQA